MVEMTPQKYMDQAQEILNSKETDSIKTAKLFLLLTHMAGTFQDLEQTCDMQVSTQEETLELAKEWRRRCGLAKKLVDKIESIQASPAWSSVFTLAHIHGEPYDGEMFNKEMKAFKESLQHEAVPTDEDLLKWAGKANLDDGWAEDTGDPFIHEGGIVNKDVIRVDCIGHYPTSAEEAERALEGISKTRLAEAKVARFHFSPEHYMEFNLLTKVLTKPDE